MGAIGVWEWLIILLVVVLLFGTKKLRNIGEDLGSAVRGFKDGMKSAEEKAREPAPQQLGDARTPIEGEANQEETKRS